MTGLFRRRDFLTLATAAAVAPAWPFAGLAQVSAKVPRVALVTSAIAVDQMYVGKDLNWGAFVDQMAIDGFVEGKTVTYDRYLMPGGTQAQNDDNARIVLATKPNAIFWGGAPQIALSAKSLNTTIPMVVETGDVIGQGLVSNPASPESNLTGLSVTSSADFEGKMLALLAEAMPGAKSFAYTNSGIADQFRPLADIYVQSVSAAARKLGLTMIPIVYASGGGQAEFSNVFDKIKAAKAEMVVFGTETSLSATAQQVIVAKMALDARVPSISQTGAFAEVGGLLGYGGNYPYMARRCADYVAMLLKGSKPSDLPVLQPTVFDLVINFKTANAIGVTIPASLLAQATEVIQ